MIKIPVLTIDGPSGSGKGTVGKIIAAKLGWHFLDSGAMYRILGFAALQQDKSLDDEKQLVKLLHALHIQFDDQIFLNGKDITNKIRTEEVGRAASEVAKWSKVREALLAAQRNFQKPPGLVADGRDMGTVVFTNASCKIFLEASAEERAHRRYCQLREQGNDANLSAILQDLKTRDERDRSRIIAPLIPAADAKVIDTTSLSIDAVVTKILQYLDL